MGGPPPWLEVATALLDGLADPAWLADAGTLRVTAVNRAAEAWLGSPRGALCGRGVLDMAVTPEDFAYWFEVQAGMSAADADDDPAASALDSETLARAAGGALRPVQRRIRRLALGAGAHCFLVQWQDRSEHRRSEAAQAQRIAELTATLEATADGILVTALDGSIINFNRRFAALWQLPPELQTRRHDDEVLTWMQRSMAHPAAYMRRLAALDDAADEPTQDSLLLRGGRVIERFSLPRRGEGVTAARVWSFREAAAGG